MTFISTALIIFAIIPLVPVFAYVIGLLVPASHIISRSSTFKTTPHTLWSILTDVTNYPQWQPKVEKVVLDKFNQEETVFIEYSTKKRHTVIIHHEHIKYKSLLRILEERPISTLPSKIPTFSGSWTFEITQEKEHDDLLTLKITEQGVIKKPMVRVIHLLLFGFYSRIDRFLNDLHKKIAADNTQVPSVDFSKDPLFYSIIESTTLPKRNLSATDLDHRQQIATNDFSILSESRVGDKEWDLMSEIYERTPTSSL
ncbi:hypothetical protein MFLAVUS_000391 [Mucor flavus]|uniref:Coenzyme Q-binding protein COQ10 START domain-containing protein n=1 Tax=Mucor flavus TaxID=439312 RepID=A0ABP9YJK7_9FUNG